MPIDYRPQDTETTIYLLSSPDWDLRAIMDMVERKWGITHLYDQVTIRAEYIHVRCIGYDLYDSSDYDNYLVIERQY